VKPRQVAYIVAPEAKGDQALEPGIENGVKVFDVEASIVRWNILSNVAVEAYAYNRQVPGPRLQLTEGDHVRSASAMRFRKARRSTGTD
jgi:manganese oxidase